MRQSQFTEILLLTQINFGRSRPKKEKKINLEKKILTKKEMPESSAWATNYKFNHSIFLFCFVSPKEQVIPWWEKSIRTWEQRSLVAPVAAPGGAGPGRLVPWGFPRERWGEMGNEESSHQNLSSAPQFVHVLNSGPRESWRVGKPSFIN